MIFFLATRANRFPVDRYLASWGQRFMGVVQPMSYDVLLSQRQLHPGAYVFADVELLSDGDRLRAAEVWDRLRGMEEVVLINHPTRSLRRYDLLKALSREGVNTFNVFRLDEDLEQLRFPAFLRRENDHQGVQLGPFADRDTLDAAIASVSANGGTKGWLLTEFCDTSAGTGLYRKYSAFMLNGRVIPRHVLFSANWCLKLPDLQDEEKLAVEMEYLRGNPHEAQLRRIFELAGIEYGRIDYGLLDGRIQVWEINTNPIILSFKSRESQLRMVTQENFSRSFAAAMQELAETPAGRRRENYPGQRASAIYHRFQAWPSTREVVRRAVRVRRMFSGVRAGGGAGSAAGE